MRRVGIPQARRPRMLYKLIYKKQPCVRILHKNSNEHQVSRIQLAGFTEIKVLQCITVVFLMLPTESSMDDLLTHSCRTITKLRPLSFLAHGQQKLFTWMTARTCPGVCTVNNPSGGSARHFQRIKHKCTDFHMIRREATFPVPHLNPPRTLNN